MAKLKAMPEKDIISGFKGVIDFYIYRHSANPEVGMPGVPCARKWPRSPGHKRSPAVEAQWAAFSTASRLWTQLSPQVQESYKAMSQGSSLSGRDIFTKGYLRGIFTYDKGVGMNPSFNAYLSVDFENILHATPTKITFDTELFDIGGNFDIVNNRFIAPRAGTYIITATLNFINILADKQYTVAIVVNGADYHWSSQIPGSPAWCAVNNAIVLYLESADFVEVYAYHNAGVDTIDLFGSNNPSWTSFSGSLIE